MEYTQDVIQKVSAIVSPVYLVGGSVRDLLLQKVPDDFDFTTPLSPDEVEERIRAAGRHVYAIGKKFGTLGFKVPDLNGKFQKVEVTTFRAERYTPGSRKPEVQFVSELHDDLGRRDFTINAIAYSDDYYDPFGGRIDILERKIKAVGKATDRFKEDPLRMLRAARFAAQLGFDVDPNLIGFIRKLAETICTISRERWVAELDKLLLSDQPEVGLDMLSTSHLLRFMLPEVNATWSAPFLREETRRRLHDAPHDAHARWAALLADIGKPVLWNDDIMHEEYRTFRGADTISRELARGICLRLKFSNDRIDVVDNQFKTKSGGNEYVQEEVSSL